MTPNFFKFHIRILKVIFCRSKKTFVGLEITGPYLLKTKQQLTTNIFGGPFTEARIICPLFDDQTLVFILRKCIYHYISAKVKPICLTTNLRSGSAGMPKFHRICYCHGWTTLHLQKSEIQIQYRGILV